LPHETPECIEIIVGFNTRWILPNCAREVNRIYIKVKCPLSGSWFYKYKGNISTSFLAIVDNNYCFTYTNAENYRKAYDGGILAKSRFSLQ
jgi:hypothetical protein